MTELEARITEAMQRLAQNIERAKANPQAVLQGGFRGKSRSGRVTVWVDALGRPEQVHIAPAWLREGDEQLLAHEFMEAVTRARHAADNLDFEGSDEPSEPRPPSGRPRDARDDDDGWDSGGSILR